MKQRRDSGFTLIELLMAMVLVSLISVACIWIFKQSLDISTKARGRALVNNSFRVAQDKLRKDFAGCLPLKSGLQHFIMISRYRYVESFDRTFPQDYISFATSTRVTSDVTIGFVSYDVTLENKESVLYRYVSSQYDFDNSILPGAGTLRREEVVRGCVQMRVEYIWRDPRSSPVATMVSNLAHEKNVPNPGIYMTLHPFVNEADTGRNYFTLYKTGGYNGSNVLEQAAGVKHAGLAASVGSERIVSGRYGTGVLAHNTGDQGGVLVPDPNDILLSVNEVVYGTPRFNLDPVSAVNAPTTTAGGACGLAWIDDYIRVIHIRSPNLYNTGLAQQFTAASAIPYDIASSYPSGATWSDPSTVTSDAVAYDNPLNLIDYKGVNAATSDLREWATYVPKLIRITLKIQNPDRSVTSTQSFVFSLPKAGS